MYNINFLNYSFYKYYFKHVFKYISHTYMRNFKYKCFSHVKHVYLGKYTAQITRRKKFRYI